ncbi:hypothetical protein IOD14_26960 [Streptomyces sp. A2-16]|uniref:hypothetical protein n=1 Tax=Streptomyces sp. A2-16 TaxID=2781734 RepID=UPI001BB02444|nr:hypothetical protein [Streptomyces sp. A2-16]QUC60101.1 hypothetical protein IOD14_26960 [Streptomyces sp. A2-16]
MSRSTAERPNGAAAHAHAGPATGARQPGGAGGGRGEGAGTRTGWRTGRAGRLSGPQPEELKAAEVVKEIEEVEEVEEVETISARAAGSSPS